MRGRLAIVRRTAVTVLASLGCIAGAAAQDPQRLEEEFRARLQQRVEAERQVRVQAEQEQRARVEVERAVRARMEEQLRARAEQDQRVVTIAPTQDGRGVTSQSQQASRPSVRGFNVVLVLGESLPSTSPDDVPPAARRALADMKDFLPFKSYRLLDAAWIAGSHGDMFTRLKGPDTQEYVLNLRSSTGNAAGNLSITVRLQESPAVVPQPFPPPPNQAEGQLINTRFDMQVGETVVVGTSRVKGDKALIMLLTAAPPGK